jgi:hypothetical protein
MYKRTEHKNALIKLVKEKRMILQCDAAKRLNRDNINDTAKVLVEQGKIKRQKVKVRGKVGNLTDQYLLYSSDVKQGEILEYEKELINRPFQSPLKKNHCYKKKENPVEQELKSISKKLENTNNNNIIDMQEYIKVNNKELKIKEFHGERVVTFKEIDELHERPDGTARQTFNRNKKYFEEGKHYFVCQTYEAQKMGITAPNGLKLLTERGYLLLVKAFTDDLSWKVQDILIESYFKVKEFKELQNNNLPITQQDLNFNGIYDMMKLFAGGIADLNDRVKVIENTIEGFKKAITG